MQNNHSSCGIELAPQHFPLLRYVSKHGRTLNLAFSAFVLVSMAGLFAAGYGTVFLLGMLPLTILIYLVGGLVHELVQVLVSTLIPQ